MNWLKKIVFNEKIKYLFWGAMTTLMYFIARFASMILIKDILVPVAIAQVVSIAFAFLVNKYFVFNHQKQHKKVASQAIIFIIGRVIVAGVDFLLSYLMIDKFSKQLIDLLALNKINYHLALFTLPIINKLIGSPVLLNSVLSVIIIQVIIIVANFFISKYFAFN